MRIEKQISSLLLAAALLAGICSAQEFRGRIQGTCHRHQPGSYSRRDRQYREHRHRRHNRRQTNESGHYLFDLVMPGTYTVSMEFPGIQQIRQGKCLASATWRRHR